VTKPTVKMMTIEVTTNMFLIISTIIPFLILAKLKLITMYNTNTSLIDRKTSELGNQPTFTARLIHSPIYL